MRLAVSHTDVKAVFVVLKCLFCRNQNDLYIEVLKSSQPPNFHFISFSSVLRLILRC